MTAGACNCCEWNEKVNDNGTRGPESTRNLLGNSHHVLIMPVKSMHAVTYTNSMRAVLSSRRARD